ncbi:hypothetical protein [Streptomyces sp. NPDC059063]|uniref:hypothetical protein n=1 Tax=unclassified Streptomyces TaxID=2593676 RepID=UPI003676F55E
MIAVVGHGDLCETTLARLEVDLRVHLARFAAAGRMGLVRAGQGLPVTVGRAARWGGLGLVTVLPAKDRLPAVLPDDDRRAAGELLMLSQQMRLVEYDPADRADCLRVDELLLRGCARVLAVWDGSAADSLDTTAHLVAHARSHDIPVDVLWPRSAVRALPGRGGPGPEETVGGPE